MRAEGFASPLPIAKSPINTGLSQPRAMLPSKQALSKLRSGGSPWKSEISVEHRGLGVARRLVEVPSWRETGFGTFALSAETARESPTTVGSISCLRRGFGSLSAGSTGLARMGDVTARKRERQQAPPGTYCRLCGCSSGPPLACADSVRHVVARIHVQRDHSAAADLDPYAFEVWERANPVADNAWDEIAGPREYPGLRRTDLAFPCGTERRARFHALRRQSK